MKKRVLNNLNLLAEIYIFFIIVIYPLMVDKTGFFKILEYKWKIYAISSIIYILLNLGYILYSYIILKVNIFRYINKNKIVIYALIFLFLIYISSLLSPYYNKYNLWIGVGRGEGIIINTLYLITFIFIILFGKFNNRMLYYLIISGILVSFICIIQYIGFNPFNMYRDGIGTHNVSFMGTIGNLDFLSMLLCIYISISFVSYVLLDKLKYKYLFPICFTMNSFLLGIINVNSGKLALSLSLIIFFLLFIKDNKKLSKSIFLSACFLLSYAINLFINPTFYYDTGKLILNYQYNHILVLYIIIIIGLFTVAKLLYNTKYIIDITKINKSYYIVLIILSIISLIIIYFIPINHGFIYEIKEILHGNFNDEFGTYRLFLWKRSFIIFKEHPILGIGADSFAIPFMSKFSKDIIEIGEYSINDTAGNIYITNLVNFGIVGLISYLVLLFNPLYTYFKNKTKDIDTIFIIVYIVLLIQNFFNLSVVIITPIFWVFLSILILGQSDKKTKKHV